MLINYQDISIFHQDTPVLEHVNLQLNEGEFVYLIGRVGTGKSSLMKTMYGEYDIKEGTAEVLGHDIRKLKRSKLQEVRRQMGIVFQDFQLLNDRTVEANLKFVLQATGWKKKEIAPRIQEVLKMVGMENHGSKIPNELSGGEQQRIVIARAILNNPKIILADEPTGNLDVDTSKKIVQLLHNICETGTAVIMTTHNLALINYFPGVVYRCMDNRLTNITEEFNKPFDMDEMNLLELVDHAQEQPENENE